MWRQDHSSVTSQIRISVEEQCSCILHFVRMYRLNCEQTWTKVRESLSQGSLFMFINSQIWMPTRLYGAAVVICVLVARARECVSGAL